MPAGAPKPGVSPPDVVVSIAARRPIRAVWESELGGLTFEIGRDPDRVFVKWLPSRNAGEPDAEAARLRWAARYTPVPEVLDAGGNVNGAWLLTRALPGENAVSARWRADPGTAVRAIGSGLRALHDALPVASCPYFWSAQERVMSSQRRAQANQLVPSRWHAIHRHLSVDDALAEIAHPPPAERLVVCHGDACAPNTLLSPDGRWSGHVDLGSLGVADPWADLAVAIWSTEWNYGPGWEALLLDAYGIDPDLERTRYYRLLWDLGP